MFKIAFGFIVGVIAAPKVKTAARPLARKAVKGGLAASQYVHKLVQEAKEDLEDLSAEAQAELNTKRAAKASSTTH